MADTDLYDAEHALRKIAQWRRRRDDLMAAHMTDHFGPETHETVGLTLVHAAACIGGLHLEGGPELGPEMHTSLVVLTNVLAFAGQRLVIEARVADTARGGSHA